MKAKTLIRVGLLAGLVVLVAWALMHRDQFSVEDLQARFRALGAWAPLAYVGAYAVATVLFLPGSVFTITGGALFGPVWGTLYSLSGATLGASLAFLIARYLASDWVTRRTGGWLGRLIHGVENEGWRFVAFTRLVPIFPFNALNYALGLTRIRFWHYVLASFVCMAPGAFAYTYIGYAGAKAIVGGRGTITTVLIALGVFAAVLFLPRLIKRLRRDDGRDANGEQEGKSV